MRILKLTVNGVSKVTAYAHMNNKTNKLNYNLKLGIPGENFGYWLGVVSSAVALPEKLSDELDLSASDKYVMTAMKANGAPKKDKLGNTLYKITKDNSDVYKKDILVIWEIPNNNFVDVKYTIEGNAKELGIGYNGKDRGDYIYKSPVVILEVTGDCTLEWQSENIITRDLHMEKITYEIDKDNWTTNYIITPYLERMVGVPKD